MLLATINDIPGMKIDKVLGVSKGSTVRSRNIGRDIGASFKVLLVGKLKLILI